MTACCQFWDWLKKTDMAVPNQFWTSLYCQPKGIHIGNEGSQTGFCSNVVFSHKGWPICTGYTAQKTDWFLECNNHWRRTDAAFTWDSSASY